MRTDDLGQYDKSSLGEAQPKETGRRRLSSRYLVYPGVILAVVMLIGAFVYRQASIRPYQYPFSNDVQKQLDFRVIYPTRLPKGYILDKKSVTVSDDTLLYSIKTPTGEITVTQQAKPKNEIGVEFPQTKRLDVAVGKAIISRFKDSQTIISVTTTDSLVFFSTRADLPDDQAEDLVKNLRRN